MRFFVAVLLLLAGCSEDPQKIAYKERIKEAQEHCRKSGGDEFKPYGFEAWRQVVLAGSPLEFRCVKLGKFMKTGVAVYILKPVGSTGVNMEIRD